MKAKDWKKLKTQKWSIPHIVVIGKYGIGLDKPFTALYQNLILHFKSKKIETPEDFSCLNIEA